MRQMTSAALQKMIFWYRERYMTHILYTIVYFGSAILVGNLVGDILVFLKKRIDSWKEKKRKKKEKTKM